MRDALPIPAEVEIFGTYFPPLLLAATLGSMAMVVTVYVLNHFGLSRYFYLPEFVMLAVAAIYTVFFGTFVFPT